MPLSQPVRSKNKKELFWFGRELHITATKSDKSIKTFVMLTCLDSCPSRKLMLGCVGFGNCSVSDFHVHKIYHRNVFCQFQ